MNQNDDKIPRTADGHIIYPMMPVFLCSPYSVPQVIPQTVHHVLEGGHCVLVENMFSAGDYHEDGNTEHSSWLYASRDECRKTAEGKYAEYLAEETERLKARRTA